MRESCSAIKSDRVRFFLIDEADRDP